MKKANAGKFDQRQSKDSVDDAELNREELVKKIASGKLTIGKSDEKKHTFKRNKITKKVIIKSRKFLTLVFRIQMYPINFQKWTFI